MTERDVDVAATTVLDCIVVESTVAVLVTGTTATDVDIGDAFVVVLSVLLSELVREEAETLAGEDVLMPVGVELGVDVGETDALDVPDDGTLCVILMPPGTVEFCAKANGRATARTVAARICILTLGLMLWVFQRLNGLGVQVL